MAAIISLLIILTLSLLVVRIAASALTLTGASREMSRFQAQSAFTGVGYTTQEAEHMLTHPVRRRIISIVMLLGNAGVITAISSLILSFINVKEGEMAYRLMWLLIGLVALWFISVNKWIDYQMQKIIEWALSRWTSLEVFDYANLLRLSGNYSVREMKVEPSDWVAGQEMKDLDLFKEGVVILGITRESGDYIGAPTLDTEILEGDVLILYGREEVLAELDERKKGTIGDAAHERSVEEQSRVLEKQNILEQSRKKQLRREQYRQPEQENSE